MKTENLLKTIINNCFALIGACQYCERSCGLYKHGALYESDVAEFEMFRG